MKKILDMLIDDFHERALSELMPRHRLMSRLSRRSPRLSCRSLRVSCLSVWRSVRLFCLSVRFSPLSYCDGILSIPLHMISQTRKRFHVECWKFGIGFFYWKLSVVCSMLEVHSLQKHKESPVCSLVYQWHNLFENINPLKNSSHYALLLAVCRSTNSLRKCLFALIFHN